MMTNKKCILILSLFMLALLFPFNCFAAEDSSGELILEGGSEGGERLYRVEGSSYKIYMNDDEDLLSPSEEEELLSYMLPVTEYGHAAFMTTQIGSSDYEGATKDFYHSLFSSDSGVIFLIDMNHRQLVIISDGEIYKVLKKGYANTITDNVYRMARKGDYAGCAEEAFYEIYALLSGDKIAQPMRHITNALLAITLAALILYFITRQVSKQREAGTSEILSTIGAVVHFSNGASTFTRRSKVYNPPSDSDGGGIRGGGFSGGGGGFGGGFGGGSSGGGGSHGF